MARSNNDPKCIHYARFAAHLDRAHFDVIYWVLFIIVIFMLFAASFRYGRSIDDVADLVAGSPEHNRRMRRCMLVCGIYAVISVVAVVMEVFALMALQFCDGEDLMALYWSTWTVMQIGSLIAIFGVLLAVFHTIRGRKHPPWALALGTPVLVVAGLGHIIQGALHKKVKTVRGRSSISRTGLRGRSQDPATSTTRTAHPEDSERDEPEYHYSAKLLGYTPDGATILQFCPSASSPLNPLLSPSAQARIIGTNVNGQVIVALRHSKAIITTGAHDSDRRPVPESSARRRGITSARVEEPVAGRKTPPVPSSSGAPTVAGSSSPGGRTSSVKLDEPLSRKTTAVPPNGGSLTTTAGTMSPETSPSAGGSSPVTRTSRRASFA